MAVGTTYIVIEIPEKENGLDIVNYLMTQTKARFTITKNIGEYAEEKGKLAGSSSASESKEEPPRTESRASVAPPVPAAPAAPPAPPAPVAPVAPIREESPEIEEIEPEIVHIPKQEHFDHPPEPYLQPIPQYQPPQYQLENCNQMFEAWQQKLNMTLPMNQYQQPAQNDYEDWQMDAAEMSAPGPMRKPDKKRDSNESTKNKQRGRPRRSTNSATRNRQGVDQKCAVCDANVKVIAFDMNARANHAIIHLDFKRYACPIDGCTYTSKHRSNAYSHVRNNHGPQGRMAIPEALTPEQKAEFNEMICKCFPEMRNKIHEMTRGTYVDYEVDEDGVEEVSDDL